MSLLKNISHKAYDIEKIRYVNFVCKNPNVKKKNLLKIKVKLFTMKNYHTLVCIMVKIIWFM